MTFDDLWARLEELRPELKDDTKKFEFTREQLRRITEQAFNQGVKHQRDLANVAEKFRQKVQPQEDPFRTFHDTFKGLFG